MAMPPLDQKGKNAIAVVVVLLIGAGAYWNYLWNPHQKDIDATALHADSLEVSNARIKKEVAGGMEAKLRADANKYSDELIGLRRLVPTENEVPAMLDAISTEARQVGLEVSEFASDGTLPGDDFDMVKYRFAVTGPYHKVAQLLTSIASSPRIISPINVAVSVGSATESRRPKANETFVNVRFGVITYVAKTKASAPAVPAAPPARPGGK
jgi:type IV pilus assembly protein PilO